MADVISEFMTDVELLADEVIERYLIGSDTKRFSSSTSTYFWRKLILVIKTNCFPFLLVVSCPYRLSLSSHNQTPLRSLP